MATLIDVATPGPALSLVGGLQNTYLSSSDFNINNQGFFGPILDNTSGALDYKSLAPGTYCITGLAIVGNLSGSIYLSTTNGSLADSFPTQGLQLTTQNTYSWLKSAVVKISATTTIYLNGTATGYIVGCLFITRTA